VQLLKVALVKAALLCFSQILEKYLKTLLDSSDAKITDEKQLAVMRLSTLKTNELLLTFISSGRDFH